MSTTTSLFAELSPTVGPLVGSALTKRIGERTLWHDLDVALDPGSITAITGPSGSGKTTLLNVLGLLEPLTSGVVTYDGRSWSGLSQRSIRGLYRDTIGFLFQNYALVEQWSVQRNLRLVLRAKGVARHQHPGLIAAALAAVGLTGRDSSPVYTLSGGEQQRVAIARLLIHRPHIIFADEPTAALDRDNAEIVLGHLQRFADAGAIIVISTHDQNTVQTVDHRIELALPQHPPK